MKRVFNDVESKFNEVAQTADQVKPMKMEIDSQFYDITEDNNIL